MERCGLVIGFDRLIALSNCFSVVEGSHLSSIDRKDLDNARHSLAFDRDRIALGVFVCVCVCISDKNHRLAYRLQVATSFLILAQADHPGDIQPRNRLHLSEE